MRRVRLVLALVVSLLPLPALADGKVYVQLPTLPTFAVDEAKALLEGMVLANIVSSNCPGYEVTEAEWSLLTDSADMVAYGQLGLSVDDYDALYYQPAFAALDDPDTCDTEGPAIEPMLENLVRLGGSREPLADQDAGYRTYQALQAQWDARAGKGPRTKSK
jgi:hypothetical protein